MIQGMTGFGRIGFQSSKADGFIEIKSVNHRYLDIGYYLPPGFASIESRIREILQKKLERGHVTVSLKITTKPALSVAFNQKTAKTYIYQAQILKNNLGLSGHLSLADIIHLPGVIETNETAFSLDELWPILQKGVHQAFNSLLMMRKREGVSLAKDTRDKLRLMSLQINKIQSRAKVILHTKKKVLNDEEFMSFQKSNDINEEISRLVHHTEEFRLLLNANGAVGKKLDFVAQEMQRETNTIGSKVQDKIVSNAVIALKSKIEKLREQAQNIE